MPDDRPDENPLWSDSADQDAPFDEGSTPFEEAGSSGPESFEGGPGPLPGGLDASLALHVARSWIKQHQKATMLGALAAGVVIGSLFRD